MGDYVDDYIHGELRTRIKQLERQVQFQNRVGRRTQREQHADLENRLLILSLVNNALIELLVDKQLASQDEIRAKIQAVADRHLAGDDDISPEALAEEMEVEVESSAAKRKRRANKEELARERLRRFRRQPDDDGLL